MERIRTFIAIPLSAEVLAEIDKMIRTLKPEGRNVKWVRPQSIHLTLKFLGNITVEERERVITALDRVFRTPPPRFSLVAGGSGVFPDSRRPRVFWVGVQGEGMSELINLQKSIETELESEGFPGEERKFSPHLTVGRIRSGRRLDMPLETFTAYPFVPVEFRVEKVDLMKSELHTSGAVYTIQKSFELQEII